MMSVVNNDVDCTEIVIYRYPFEVVVTGRYQGIAVIALPLSWRRTVRGSCDSLDIVLSIWHQGSMDRSQDDEHLTIVWTIYRSFC